MPNDPQWLMGALAASDAYRGDEPAWPDGPSPWADYMSRDQPLPTHAPQQEPDKYQRLAGGIASLPANAVHSFFGGPAAMNKPNPYPEGSDLAQHFENTRADIPYQYGPATAVGLWGMGPRVKGGLSATGGSEIVQPQPMAELAKPFYSAAEQAVTTSPLTKAPPAQWLGTLRNTPGVKADEIERLGLENFLRQQQGAVPKQALADYVAANKVDVGEVRKLDQPQPAAQRVNSIDDRLHDIQSEFDRLHQFNNPAANERRATLAAQERELRNERAGIVANWQDQASGRTKFSRWQLPGGENYRETLLTLPRANPELEAVQKRIADITMMPASEHARLGEPLRTEFDMLRDREYQLKAQQPAQFTAGHFSEPNVLAHYRTNDRTIDGKKTLFLEEVQSDWHQKGREQGYRAPEAERAKMEAELQALQAERARLVGSADPADRARYAEAANREGELTDLYNKTIHDAIPDAPFKTTWHELALKRAIRDAAEGGYDQIAWTPGSVQNARYDLSKHISDLQLHGTGDNLRLTATDLHGRKVIDMQHTTREGLADIIGKEPAEKLLSQPEPNLNNPYAARNLFDADLKVGGKGMEGFYDKMLPAAANKLGKKHGAQVGEAQMDVSGGKPLDSRYHAEDEGVKTVHTLPITPSLRETALRKGFPLFVTGGVTTMGALAASDRYANQ